MNWCSHFSYNLFTMNFFKFSESGMKCLHKFHIRVCGIMDIILVILQSVLIWKTLSTSGAEKGHDGASEKRRLLQVNLLAQIKLIFLT